MNSLQIATLLHTKGRKVRKIFGGVLSADQILNIKPAKTLKFYICNVSESSEFGLHWYILGVSDKHVEIFDSTAKIALGNSYLLQFISNHSNLKFKFNTKQYQADVTETCGLWCILFILHRAQNRSMESFLNQFTSRNLINNDKKIVKLFFKSFH